MRMIVWQLKLGSNNQERNPIKNPAQKKEDPNAISVRGPDGGIQELLKELILHAPVNIKTPRKAFQWGCWSNGIDFS